MRHARITLLFVMLAFAASACASNPYQLPPPPPRDEWIDDAVDPKADERRREMLYLEARTSLLGLFNLLSNQRYEEASAMVSAETRDFLTRGGQDEFTDVLAAGKLALGNGEVVEIDPVSTLVAPDLTGMVDTVDGIGENETDARKELFVPVDGGYLRIVMIKEGGNWVLHRTRLPQPIQPQK
jgi:hypothetical protein